MTVNIKPSILRAGAAVVLALVAWQILSLRISEYYQRQAEYGDSEAAFQALAWRSDNPRALYLAARELMEKAPARARELLGRAIAENPADGRHLALMARLQADQGAMVQADELIRQAVLREPANKQIRLETARYWVQRGQLQQALQNWDVALLLDPGLGKQIYPLMLSLAQQPEGRKLLEPFIQSPPLWWEGFFSYLTEHAGQLEVPVAVASMRHASSVPLSREERRLLVARLQKEQQWAEAYLVWVNGLTPGERRYLGNVFDGGFELPPSEEGFGWHFPNLRGVLARRRQTYGMEGERALQLIFKGEQVVFRHLQQWLFLSQGMHEFAAMARVDRLHTRGGLKWRVRCADDPETVLGESSALVGASDWGLLQFRFQVPEGAACQGQMLRLESVGESGYDHKLDGEVWFDSLAITRLDESSASTP